MILTSESHTAASNGSLKVFEAYTRDVGRNVARIDQMTMTALDVHVGEVLELKGKDRTTVALCLPLYPSDEGKSIIRLDGLTRNNAGVSVGNNVVIRKVKAELAESLVLAPIEAIPPIDGRYVADALEGVPVTIGDTVMVPYFGGRLSFRVLGILPAHEQKISKNHDNTNHTLAPVLIKQKTNVILVNDVSNRPIKLDIREYVRQEPEISCEFSATGVINDATTADGNLLAANSPLFLGFRMELTCLNTTERIDYQVRLSKKQANDISSLAQNFIDLAQSELNAANDKVITEIMKGNIAASLSNQVGTANAGLPNNDVQKMLRDLKYAIVKKWTEIKTD